MRKCVDNLILTGLGSLVLGICLTVIGCATATKVEPIPITSNKEEKKGFFNLAGRWATMPTKQGYAIVEIIQEGNEIKAYWRSFPSDFPMTRCAKDTIFFEGRIKENKVPGTWYPCAAKAEPRVMEILEGADLLSIEARGMVSGQRVQLKLKRIK
jgi:hypothetical protein